MTNERIADLERELEELREKCHPLYGHPLFDKVKSNDRKLYGAASLGLVKRDPSYEDMIEFVKSFKPHKMVWITTTSNMVGAIAPEQKEQWLKRSTEKSCEEISPWILYVSEYSTELKWFTVYGNELYQCDLRLPQNGNVRYSKKLRYEPGYTIVTSDTVHIPERMHKVFGSNGRPIFHPLGSLNGEHGRSFYINWENGPNQISDIESFLSLYFGK